MLDQHAVHHPSDGVDRVSIRECRRHPPSARLVEWHLEVDMRLAMLLQRLQRRLPGRGHFADILARLSLDQTRADLPRLETLPIKLLRVALKIALRVAEHALHVDRRGGELHGSRIAEHQGQNRMRAGRHGLRGLETAPSSGDLGEQLLAWLAFAAVAVLRDHLAQRRLRAVKLVATNVGLHQCIARVATHPLVSEQRAIDRDEMLVRRELEAPDPVGGFCEALVVRQCVERELTLFRFRITAVEPTIRFQRLCTELRFKNLSALEFMARGTPWRQSGAFRQRKPPALAIVLRSLPVRRDGKQHRSIATPRRALGPTGGALIRPLRQLVQRSEHLHFPEFRTVTHRRRDQIPGLCADLVIRGFSQGLHQPAQALHPVAVTRIHHFSGGTILASAKSSTSIVTLLPLKLSRKNPAPVGSIAQAGRRHDPQRGIVRMSFHCTL